jgi:alkylated DNA repair dioxygenase AlkB
LFQILKTTAFEIVFQDKDENVPLFSFLSSYVLQNIPLICKFAEHRQKYFTTTLPQDIVYQGNDVASFVCLSKSLSPQQPSPFIHFFFSICNQVFFHLFEEKTNFNCALLNKYRDEKDSMGLHADNETWIENGKNIMNIAFGEERHLSIIRNQLTTGRKLPEILTNVDYLMKSGSCIVFRGNLFQYFFLHGVAKEGTNLKTRYSFNFRQHLSSTMLQTKKKKN